MDLIGKSPKYTESEFITSYPAKDVKFFDFLKNVLYRKYQDHFKLETCPETGCSYISVTGLDTLPAKVFYNFCIASRAPFEFVARVCNWNKLCSAGLHPSIAFAICGFTNSLDSNVPFCDNNHWAIPIAASVSNLLYGPTVTGSSYIKHPDVCVPCNLIWGNDQSLRPMWKMSVRQFCHEWKEKHNEDLLLAS